MAAEFASIVLAGGMGRRLGRDKLWVELGGENLPNMVMRTLSALGGPVILVLDRKKPVPALPPSVKVVTDLLPGRGSLGGIYTGLKLSDADRVLAVACDMPFLSIPLLRHLLKLSLDYDVVVPRPKGGLEPLHAVYGRGCLNPMKRLLATPSNRIFDFYHEVRVHYVGDEVVDKLSPGEMSFFNINTPADLEQAQRLVTDRA
ncbi:MAG: molybdenum cofactor guanylyltransferase [Dehalococcoidia bacterium]|nr:molybdenum cofactor guanylyltransferase [Dehalococcoidia bacterium]MDP7239641.1 molybdenum cofactor guanylyltransferase [Dehalococcoidia bacterium]